MDANTPLIEFSQVDINNGDSLVISNLDFTLNKGYFVYLTGKVGSGKSSLLKTTYCELDIEEAEKAEALGRNLLELRRKDIPALRREMGIIFQSFQLLHDRSVKKNMEFVLKATGWKNKEERKERIEEVLEAVGMLDKKNKMPHELSGGEQQRVAIARALLNNPKIIIADEPTGNLDPETAGNIVTLLKNISQTGTAIVMTTHNMPMLDRFPGIVYRCKDGKLIDVTKDYNKLDLTEDGEES